jgi:integrase
VDAKGPQEREQAKSYLYPGEDARLASCTDVVFERRLVYGILNREGMRVSELALLKWSDVDLEHGGSVRLDRNKTDDPRAWALSPDVVRTLSWWKRKTGGESGDFVVRFNRANAAWWLRGDIDWKEGDSVKRRGDLRAAGITRPELFERSKTRLPIRVHDLRATFVTVSLANGKTEPWVTARTGHKSSQMVALYARQARMWTELNLGPLHALDELLPELREEPSTAPTLHAHCAPIVHPSRCGWDLNPRMTVLQTVA